MFWLGARPGSREPYAPISTALRSIGTTTGFCDIAFRPLDVCRVN
jgi:hypothetical protein